MAPSAILINPDVIRIYLGCWDANGISRIGYIDVEAGNPQQVVGVSDRPLLDIGDDGCFDENGVFPAHASKVGGCVYLYYTGFQLGHKVPHYNFGGLAVSEDGGNSFRRWGRAPVLDRTEEGLCVRAGQSVFVEDGNFHTCYSAGSEWAQVGGKQRPVYHVYYQSSPDGVTYRPNGRRIVECDPDEEHGLGRPQLIRLGARYYVFYTRRKLDMKYSYGYAVSEDFLTWKRLDDEPVVEHSESGFDSEMVYFPSVVDAGNDVFMFYSGNGFGRDGLGCARLLRGM